MTKPDLSKYDDNRYGNKFLSERIEKIALHADQRTDRLVLVVEQLINDLYRLENRINVLEDQMIRAQQWSPGMALRE